MESKNVTALYFSPTGGTAQVARDIAAKLKGESRELDVTVKAENTAFAPGDLVVAAVPVYGGRVPAPVAERLSHVSGGGAFAVAVAVYGNRAYEDALLELKNLLEARGFRVIGAGAFLARHSIMPRYGEGRPDGADLAKQSRLASAVAAKLAAAQTPEQVSGVTVPGNMPYRKFGGLPLHPTVNKVRCGKCGRCAAQCPVGAIPKADPTKTDTGKCITCMRCVRECPHYARSISPLLLSAAAAKLKKECTERKKPEYFV